MTSAAYLIKSAILFSPFKPVQVLKQAPLGTALLRSARSNAGRSLPAVGGEIVPSAKQLVDNEEMFRQKIRALLSQQAPKIIPEPSQAALPGGY